MENQGHFTAHHHTPLSNLRLPRPHSISNVVSKKPFFATACLLSIHNDSKRISSFDVIDAKSLDDYHDTCDLSSTQTPPWPQRYQRQLNFENEIALIVPAGFHSFAGLLRLNTKLQKSPLLTDTPSRRYLTLEVALYLPIRSHASENSASRCRRLLPIKIRNSRYYQNFTASSYFDFALILKHRLTNTDSPHGSNEAATSKTNVINDSRHLAYHEYSI
jgi:hypothetical protein